MNRGVILYAVLLLASMTWAYATWTHEGELDPDEAVIILDGKPETLVSVVYDSEKIDVTLSMYDDELGRYAWAEVVPKADAEAPEPQPDNPHAPPPPDLSPAAFKVGKSGDKTIEGLAPFTAKRRLEGVAEDQLADLGLQPAEATLTISREGREPKTYELGGNAFGGVNVYVRDPADGSLYLVDAKLIAPLQAAKRTLVDRTLFPGAQKDVRQVAVTEGVRSVTFVQKNPDDREARFWAVEGEDSANPTAAAWLDKALTLSAAEYLVDSEAPADLAPVFTMTITSAEQKKPVTVSLMRGINADGEDSFFAKSDHTRGLVRLHRSLAAEAAADLDSALGGGDEAAPE
ncbi:MAG: DUF4340 domain-containing protein [Myxococcota bacterium]